MFAHLLLSYLFVFFFHFLFIFPSRTLKTVQLPTSRGLRLWSRALELMSNVIKQLGAKVEEKYVVQQEEVYTEANQIQTPNLRLGQDSIFGLKPLCFFFFFNKIARKYFVTTCGQGNNSLHPGRETFSSRGGAGRVHSTTYCFNGITA